MAETKTAWQLLRQECGCLLNWDSSNRTEWFHHETQDPAWEAVVRPWTGFWFHVPKRDGHTATAYLNALEQDRADLIAALRLADKMLDNGAGSYEYTGPIEWEETIKALLTRLAGEDHGAS